MRYNRSALLSVRNWWKKQPRNIKPMLPTDWNACKAAGILKPGENAVDLVIG